MPLTDEQKAKIEANRQKALALRAAKGAVAVILQQQQQQPPPPPPPPPLLNDGGFTREDEEADGDAADADTGGGAAPPTAAAAAAAAAAPATATATRVALAPTNPEGGGCEVCGSSMVDESYRKVFGVPVCYPCKAAHEDEYGLVPKGEAAAEFCLQDGTIKMMPCLERRNPRNVKFQSLKLYSRKQLRAKAHERWGGAEGLEEELEARRKRKYEAALSKTANVFAKKKAKP